MSLDLDKEQVKQSHQQLISQYSSLTENISSINYQPCKIARKYLSTTLGDISYCLREKMPNHRRIAKVFSKFLQGIIIIYIFFNLNFFIITVILAKIPFVSQFINRIFVISHIKSRLVQMKEIYIFKSNQTSDGTIKDFLKPLIEECKEFSSVSSLNMTYIYIFRLICISP
ncbi:MAG: hypothetical protein F6K48_23900, partial [Okeania sp. SIO3H1]|nr:hypothetical protein [Okeania sp. SIO3H1]